MGHFVNRGFLAGPVCPIYGCGVSLIVLCLSPVQGNLLLLFVGSVLLTSLIEFVTGFVLEKNLPPKMVGLFGSAVPAGWLCLSAVFAAVGRRVRGGAAAGCTRW